MMCSDKCKNNAILKTIYELQQSKVDDTNIFKFTDMKSICEHYIDYINDNSYDCVTRQDVIRILKWFLDIDNSTSVTEDFAMKFVNKILHIYSLPKDALALCQENIATLKIEYNKLTSKLDKIIKTIEVEKKKRDIEIGKIKNKKKITRSELINELVKLDKKQKSDELYIAFTNGTKEWLKLKFAKFEDGDINDTAEQTAFSLIFYTENIEETIKRYFHFFFDILDICNHQFDDKEYIPMAIKIAPFISKILEEWKYHKMLGENVGSYEQQYKEHDTIFTEMKLKSQIRDYDYLNILKRLVNEEFLADLKTSINNTQTISKRHSIIKVAMNAYDSKNFDVCNSILVIQIEGIIHDLLIDNQIIELSNAYTFLTLKDKLQLISSSKNNEIEIIMYFKFFFNKIRNEMAHGGNSYFNFGVLEKEITSLEMLLDLNALMFWFCKDSNEYKFKEFISEIPNRLRPNDDEFVFGKLFNELKGTRAHSRPDGIEFLNSNIIIFWLFDQYMEDLLFDEGDKTNLQKCRNIFRSKSFWDYILKKMNEEIQQNSAGALSYLKQYKLETTESFKEAVKKAFNIVNNDAKLTLKEINKLFAFSPILVKKQQKF